VMLLFFIAEFLEDYAGDRARQEVGSLLRLAPETAVVVREGCEIVVHGPRGRERRGGRRQTWRKSTARRRYH